MLGLRLGFRVKARVRVRVSIRDVQVYRLSPDALEISHLQNHVTDIHQIFCAC